MKDYHTHHAVKYEPEEGGVGFTSMKVLPFLEGKKWDEVALAYVHALRPSSIRVTTGMCTLDAYKWRVTVYVDEYDVIKSITQEVEVFLGTRFMHGSHLNTALEFGLGSPQEQWYDPNEEVDYYFSGMTGYHKVVNDVMIPFPGQEEVKLPELKPKFSDLELPLNLALETLKFRDVEPVDDDGHGDDIYTKEAFIEMVECGGFIDYDGFGDFATETKVLSEGFEFKVYPSQIGTMHWPSWATHVCWYNR